MTNLSRDTLRVHIAPEHKRQIQALTPRIEALTGRKLSMPIVMRAGIAALAAHLEVAAKEQAKAKDGETGVQVWKLRNWIADAAHAAGA